MRTAANPSYPLETIQELKQIKGVRGVHIMAIEREETVPPIVKEANLKTK